MTDIDSAFSGSIPERYDTCLVPILFAGYAEDLAKRVAADRPGDVLELAAGSGVVTRALAPLLPVDTRFVATDLNPAMIEQARSRQPDADRVNWKAVDAMDISFPADSFDTVLCQFGVMFFPDRVHAFGEARRVLRSGGRFHFSAWGPIEENDFSHATTELLRDIWPEDPPLFLARTPFGYSDPDAIRQDLDAAGFTDVTIEKVAQESRTEQAGDFARAQSFGSPLRLEIEARGAPGLEAVERAITARLAERFGSGPTVGRMTAHVVSARAP